MRTNRIAFVAALAAYAAGCGHRRASHASLESAPDAARAPDPPGLGADAAAPSAPPVAVLDPSQCVPADRARALLACPASAPSSAPTYEQLQQTLHVWQAERAAGQATDAGATLGPAGLEAAQAITDYLCALRRATSEAQREALGAPDPQALFATRHLRAQIYYEAHRYEEAAVFYGDIAADPGAVDADLDVGERAVIRELDSIARLELSPGVPRPACASVLARDAARYRSRYCGARAADNRVLCARVLPRYDARLGDGR